MFQTTGQALVLADSKPPAMMRPSGALSPFFVPQSSVVERQERFMGTEEKEHKARQALLGCWVAQPSRVFASVKSCVLSLVLQKKRKENHFVTTRREALSCKWNPLLLPTHSRQVLISEL